MCNGNTSGGCHRIGEELIVGVYRPHDVPYGRYYQTAQGTAMKP